ncbi:glycerol acyltransferase, partial [Streptomyces microflavus]
MGDARIIPFDGAASGARTPAPRSGRRTTRPARAVRVPEPVEGEVPVRSIEGRSAEERPARERSVREREESAGAGAGPRRAPGTGRS